MATFFGVLSVFKHDVSEDRVSRNESIDLIFPKTSHAPYRSVISCLDTEPMV